MNDSSSAVLVTRTLRWKVTPEGYAWLNIAAMEVNTVWNWANEISAKQVIDGRRSDYTVEPRTGVRMRCMNLAARS
jgi:hypothetical protein